MLQLWIQASNMTQGSHYLLDCIKKYLFLKDLNFPEKCRLYTVQLQKMLLLRFKY